MVNVPRIGRLRIPVRLTQRWRVRLRAQRRWWRRRWRASAGSDVLFPAAGGGMVAVETLAGEPEHSGEARNPAGPRIAILHATAGSGHKRAAQALARAFSSLAPGVVVREVDTLVFASRIYRGTYAASYNAMAARAPRLWGVLYRSWALAPVNRSAGPVRLALDRLNLRRLVRVVERERPGAIVCTHFLPVEALSHARGAGKLPVPLYCVITDFTAHPFWAFPHVDRYFVASRQVADELAGHGVPRESIDVTGIPVDPRFANSIGRDAARAQLGIDGTRPMVLVMGGGSGVGPLADLAGRLSRLPGGPTVIVVCGTNERLKREVEEIAAAGGSGPTGITVLGFTDQVDVLLEACDVVVSKAGGLTCSEALIKGAPLVIYRPTPGQEVRNAEFLEAGGAALHADSIEAVEGVVRRWLGDPAARDAVRSAARALARPNAAEDIARRVLAAVPAVSVPLHPNLEVALMFRMFRRFSMHVVSLAFVAATALVPSSADAGGKVSGYVTRLQPYGDDAKKFSRDSWGGGVEAIVPWHQTYDLLAFAGGGEVVNMLGQTTEYRDPVTLLRVEQQTSQLYGRLFLGGRFGPHGAGFVRPHVGSNVALVIYNISTDVVIPDDRDREREIRQSLKSETRSVFGYDFNAGIDFNIANAFPIEVGARYLKSFRVPQQLGEGSVRVSPEYFQVYVAFGVGFDYLRRHGGS